VDDLALGAQLTHTQTGETGYVIGFYILTPEGEAHVENDPKDADAARAHWFREATYRLARAGRQTGFALIGNAGGRAYWRLANTRPTKEIPDE
jgi:hypothetical protein